MKNTAPARKARGAFFTPPPLADFITRWTIRSGEDRVFEPSCGEAGILLSAAATLRARGGEPDASRLHGVELHGPSAEAAVALLRAEGADAEVSVEDFLDMPSRPAYDAVVGNPPYVRYQAFSGQARARGQQAALAAGVRLNGLASAWAPFVVHAAEFVRPGGRLGLVLPAELLTVGYAAKVRHYLLRRFGDVRLVLFEERVFPGVLEEVVLLLAEGEGPASHFKLCQARDGSDLAADDLTWTTAAYDADSNWMPALLDAGSLDVYSRLVSGDAFVELADGWGKTGLGAVTGNNKWFTLSCDAAKVLGLPARELLRLSPPGSRHLRGLSFTERAWKDLANAGRPIYLFYPGDDPSSAARRYIAAGEEAGVHRAYKCRVRNPWWRVPLAPTPDLLLTYMNHIAPQLTANRAAARHINSVHGVTLHPARRQLGLDLLPIASLNSLTLLGAEMVGRSYGGGLLKVEPREADRWPMPAPDVVTALAPALRALRPQLATRLRRGDVVGAAKMVDRVLFPHLGVRHEELKALRDGRGLLFGRRQARGGVGRGGH